MLSGLIKERVSYDHLSTTQWVAGFCRIMKEEQNLKIRDNMLDYMISLFDDANDFSWDAAKASHAVLLCRIKQGEAKDYSQTEKNDRIRCANAQRQNPQKLNPKHSRSMPCNYIIMLALAPTPKHTKLGVYYINMCVQPAM